MEIFEKAETLWMKAHPGLTEKWVQNIIADDPSILGLGDLELRQKERPQLKAGRLDLLLQHPDTNRRFEVELQLGAVDETHIIRTIEYWDIEKKAYPQYEHCAVLIAEDVNSRFLNVLALFNASLPLIVIKMQAIKVAGKVTLVFTKVFDERPRGLVDEDEEALAAPADRSYWESKSSPASLGVVDNVLEIAKELDSGLTLNFTKHYIGLQKDGASFSFFGFRPRRRSTTIEIKHPQSDDIDKMIEEAGLETLDYDTRWNQYRLRLTPETVATKKEILAKLLQLAYDIRANR